MRFPVYEGVVLASDIPCTIRLPKVCQTKVYHLEASCRCLGGLCSLCCLRNVSCIPGISRMPKLRHRVMLWRLHSWVAALCTADWVTDPWAVACSVQRAWEVLQDA